MLSRRIKWVLSPDAKYQKIPDSEELEPFLPHSQDSKIASPRLCHASSPCSHPTHIGLAFYYFPNDYTIVKFVVLSSSQRFNGTVWFCIIKDVNRSAHSWKKCEDLNSPAFDPCLALLGIIEVDTVNKQPSIIIGSISTLALKLQHLRGGYDEYARQVLLHLCEKRIMIPFLNKMGTTGFSRHIRKRLSKMQEEPPPKTESKIYMYPIIPIRKGDVDFVQKV